MIFTLVHNIQRNTEQTSYDAVYDFRNNSKRKFLNHAFVLYSVKMVLITKKTQK